MISSRVTTVYFSFVKSGPSAKLMTRLTLETIFSTYTNGAKVLHDITKPNGAFAPKPLDHISLNFLGADLHYIDFIVVGGLALKEGSNETLVLPKDRIWNKRMLVQR
jgi:hypothetical protein